MKTIRKVLMIALLNFVLFGCSNAFNETGIKKRLENQGYKITFSKEVYTGYIKSTISKDDLHISYLYKEEIDDNNEKVITKIITYDNAPVYFCVENFDGNNTSLEKTEGTIENGLLTYLDSYLPEKASSYNEFLVNNKIAYVEMIDFYDSLTKESREKVFADVKVDNGNSSKSKEESNSPELIIIEPNVFEGKGDSVITLAQRDDIWVLYVKGNDTDKHFAVKGYKENGDSTKLFVNTTDPYEGITIDVSLETVTLEINAAGHWRIEQRSIYTCDTISKGETYEGAGDNVLLILSYGSTASIEGNKDERHFAIKSYGKNSNLMVNTTDSYSGQVMIKGDPFIFEIDSDSTWKITLD